MENSSHPKGPDRMPAAQYVRMSTELQEYSTANQADVIREYSEKRNFRIVRTYADEGKSGLFIAGRPALQRLIADVESGSPGFRAVLVYDVSRWGRFQDADESAYYEYLCKRAGIAVHYCAEQFENDGGPNATIIKSLKRAMAAEYSRELSTKVFQGKSRLIELGYRQGGTAGYGLRRMLVDASGREKGELSPGEWKSLQTDRVILVPGPANEIRVVHRIYDLFIDDGMTLVGIASTLNAKGIRTDRGRPWTRDTVREVLTNEKYIGNNVFNRHSSKLRRRTVTNDPEMWIRKEGAFRGVVDPKRFEAAQAIIRHRHDEWTDEEMIDRLRILLKRHGKLARSLIDADQDSPHSQAYIRRFGALHAAYRLTEFTPRHQYDFIETRKRTDAICLELAEELARNLMLSGASVSRPAAPNYLVVNDQLTILLLLAWRRSTPAGAPRWAIQIKKQFRADITVIGRMSPTNDEPAEYYLIPRHDLSLAPLLRSDSGGAIMNVYRQPNLVSLVRLAQRYKI